MRPFEQLVNFGIAVATEIVARFAGRTIEQIAIQQREEEVVDIVVVALPTGERQFVLIARALAHAPAVVLADEPTASLDPLSAETVMRLLLDLAAERGTTLLIASHDLALVGRFGLPRLTLSVAAAEDGSGAVSTLPERAP